MRLLQCGLSDRQASSARRRDDPGLPLYVLPIPIDGAASMDNGAFHLLSAAVMCYITPRGCMLHAYTHGSIPTWLYIVMTLQIKTIFRNGEGGKDRVNVRPRVRIGQVYCSRIFACCRIIYNFFHHSKYKCFSNFILL
jgi:hypothetical protein